MVALPSLLVDTLCLLFSFLRFDLVVAVAVADVVVTAVANASGSVATDIACDNKS